MSPIENVLHDLDLFYVRPRLELVVDSFSTAEGAFLSRRLVGYH